MKKLKYILFLIISLVIYLTVYIISCNSKYYFFSKDSLDYLFNIINIVIIFSLSIFGLLIVCEIFNVKVKRYISILLIFVLCTLISVHVYFSNYKVVSKISGDSMFPTLINDEKVEVKLGNNYQRFDIIVFELNQDDYLITPFTNSYYVKRVIGISGDKVRWVDGLLYINDKLIEEDYINTFISTEDFNGTFKYVEDGVIKESYTIPEGYCFVLGDNRGINEKGNNFSLDSRGIGLVSDNNIIGIVE